MAQINRIPFACLFISILVMIWSGISPHDRLTWWMEVAPVLIVWVILIPTYRKFRLSDLLYALVAVHAIILMVGGHYTYARVPFMEILGEGRNNYDKIGHFAQGFIPAMGARELLIRTSPLKSGKWLFAIVVLCSLGISAIYELVEWTAAIIYGGSAKEFLGSQGDVWDTQKDMMWCGIGAITAMITLSKLHDRALKAV